MVRKAMQLSPVQQYLEELHSQLSGLNAGEVASYIPELTKADPAWLGYSVEGYLFAGFVFWAFCFGMSRYSQALERKLHTGHAR